MKNIVQKILIYGHFYNISNEEMQNNLEALKKENDSLIKENDTLKKENEKLKVENQLFKIKETEKEKTLQSTLPEQELRVQIKTWQKIVDEMAHSINTDIYVAVSYQSYHKENPDIKKALAHTIQIRDLVNLTMWLLKKNEINISEEMETVNLQNIINNQLQTIYNGISTLRISSDEHEDKIKAIIPKINIAVFGTPNVLINKELSTIYDLLLKDLLRNALKNTDEQNPQMSISIFCESERVEIKIENNSVITPDFEEWFNNDSTLEPNISKSTKVGLRVIKKWVKELSLFASLKGDLEKGITITTLIIPKEVKWKR